MNISGLWSVLKTVFNKYFDDKVPKLAAALSYYTVFSIAPVLIIVVAALRFFLSKAQARAAILAQAQNFMGAQSAATIKTLLEHSDHYGGNFLATTVGIVTLLITATAVFAELQDSLNIIWGIRTTKYSGIRGLLRTRLLSFLMVLVIGILFLLSVLLSAAISGVFKYMSDIIPGSHWLWGMGNFGVSLILTTLLFATIFKVLPDVSIPWSDVWIGSFITAIFFNIGKTLIGLYLGRTAIASTYGAAGSLAVIFVWIYYASQVLFVGAEFTHVYANQFGSRPRQLKPHAAEEKRMEPPRPAAA